MVSHTNTDTNMIQAQEERAIDVLHRRAGPQRLVLEGPRATWCRWWLVGWLDACGLTDATRTMRPLWSFADSIKHRSKHMGTWTWMNEIRTR